MTRISIRDALRKSKPKCAGCGHGIGSHSGKQCKRRDGCPCVGFEQAVRP